MSGAEFDSEFVQYMVTDHRKDIQEFEAQANSSAKTRSLAAQQLPALRKHLEMALSLEKSKHH
jgi:putative membrane protein